MTDKEIIIDGVDVSGCKWRSCHICWDRYSNGERCDNYPDCYYKQLKRKEQECDQLKAENEKLNKQCDKIYIFNKELIDEKYRISLQNIKYKQALDEIEEYIKMEHWTLMNYIREDILDIINKADCRQSAECFCEAKHADTFNADNQAAKEGE